MDKLKFVGDLITNAPFRRFIVEDSFLFPRRVVAVNKSGFWRLTSEK
jgi:hypothetical protein